MEENPAILLPRTRPGAGGLARAGLRVRLWARRKRRDRSARRARRIVLLLALVWTVSGFDLVFTLIADGTGRFVEGNPIAAPLLSSPPLLAAFKFFMLAFGTAVFLTFRRRLLTEIACWATGTIYTILCGLWWVYYFLNMGTEA